MRRALNGSHATSGKWGFMLPHAPAPAISVFLALLPFTFSSGECCDNCDMGLRRFFFLISLSAHLRFRRIIDIP